MRHDRLAGKVAIITGAGQGIGKAIASVFAIEGARVVIATLIEKDGQEAVDQIRQAGGEAILCTADIGKLEQIDRVVAVTAERYGARSILPQIGTSRCSDSDLY